MLEKLPQAVGHALRHRRAGLEKILFNRVDFRAGTGRLTLESAAFVDHGPIPRQYTADGAGISPPLEWHLPPDLTGSLVLVVEDADAPTPQPLVHAIVVALPAQDDSLPEGALRSSDHPGSGLTLGQNSYLQQAWLPPDPPPGHGPHRYAFQLFALAEGAPFGAIPGREEIASALRDRGTASGLLIGTYERNPASRVAVEEAAEDAPEDAAADRSVGAAP